MTRYVFVTGGVVSSVGKGISVASIGRILESAGATWSNVVQLTTYVVGRENLDSYLEERTKIVDRLYPKGDLPPSTLLLIDGLYTEEILAEVVAVAALP